MMAFNDILKEVFSQRGFDLTELQVKQFSSYKDLLIEWNEKINLTGITEPRDVAIKHFLDSVLLLDRFELISNSSVIDVGTGAGFPGFPLKIMKPDLNVTMLDSLNKRINYLKEVGNAINTDGISYVHGRAEDIGQDHQHREKYDYAVARAVANLSVLCELCMPFVKVGGYFIAYKGRDVDSEIQGSKKALRELGGEIYSVEEISLPLEEGERHFIIIKKTRPTPSKYPRKAGTPAKKPL